jgi:hypothetical protein
VCYHRLCQWDWAIADYTAALEVDASLTAARQNRGLCCLALDFPRRAADEFSVALRTEPEVGLELKANLLKAQLKKR